MTCNCKYKKYKKILEIKEPVTVHVINTKFDEVATGQKSFNIFSEEQNVGEWLDKPVYDDRDIPENLFCVSVEDWLHVFKPKLQAAATIEKTVKKKVEQN